MPSRRLEDRIRELCAKAITAKDGELKALFLKLKSALHEHNDRLRKLAVMKLASNEEGQPRERRSA